MVYYNVLSIYWHIGLHWPCLHILAYTGLYRHGLGFDHSFFMPVHTCSSLLTLEIMVLPVVIASDRYVHLWPMILIISCMFFFCLKYGSR